MGDNLKYIEPLVGAQLGIPCVLFVINIITCACSIKNKTYKGLFFWLTFLYETVLYASSTLIMRLRSDLLAIAIGTYILSIILSCVLFIYVIPLIVRKKSRESEEEKDILDYYEDLEEE